jgi:threonine synthase
VGAEIAHFTGLQCVHCGLEYNVADVEYYCPACGYHDGILDVVYDYGSVQKELNSAALAGNRNLSMWRYLPLLPVAAPELIPHLQVGWTPLYETPRLAGELGVARCWVKDEGRNPTASFKDRASAYWQRDGKLRTSLPLRETPYSRKRQKEGASATC